MAYMGRGVPSAGESDNANRGPGAGMRVIVRAYRGGEERSPPPGGEVHVWVADLSELDGDDEVLRELLTADERARGQRYRHPRVQTQFVRCRGLLRRVLGGYLGCPPGAVPIGVRPDGKPVLDGVPSLHFNVSHAEGVALFAVADRPVGVDVEAVRPMPSAADLVARFFTDEERDQFGQLAADDRLAGFFRGWTCKEAVLKGIGCGARELDRCVVDLDPRQPARILGIAETVAGWEVTTWTPRPGFAAAVAVAVSGTPLELVGAAGVSSW